MGLFGRILPSIVVGEEDRHELLVLAMGGTGHSADQADDLLYELGRAIAISDDNLPVDVVRMGSTVTARMDGGERQCLRLSYPHEKVRNSLSIMSPMGTALLGLRAGQSMKWTSRDGKSHEVQVFSVHNRDAQPLTCRLLEMEGCGALQICRIVFSRSRPPDLLRGERGTMRFCLETHA